MTVHIVVRYRQISFEEKTQSNNQNILFSIKKMYKPCLFAALTTIFAFGSLYTSGIKPVMDFGLMMCIGLVITYISSFFFLPVLISVLNLKSTADGERLFGHRNPMFQRKHHISHPIPPFFWNLKFLIYFCILGGVLFRKQLICD